MKAITYHEYGGVEQLRLEEVDKPALRENEVLIKVHAASVNDFDLGMLMGKPYILRLQNGRSKPTKINILGSDIAGTVEAVGSAVTRFAIADCVFGDLSDRWGGFAEYCAAKEGEVEPMSDALTFEEAAALPQAAALAYQALFEYGEAKPGERILINGAGGGVGTLGVQMAKEKGMAVDGVDASSKFSLMKAVGFDELVDYLTTDFTKLNRKYDVIVDNKLNRSLFSCLKVLKPGGRYLVNGGDSARLLQVVLFSNIVNLFTGKKVRLVVLKKNSGLDYVKALHEQGKLNVVMEEPVPLEKGIEAIEDYTKNRFTGKVVIVNK